MNSDKIRANKKLLNEKNQRVYRTFKSNESTLFHASTPFLPSKHKTTSASYYIDRHKPKDNKKRMTTNSCLPYNDPKRKLFFNRIDSPSQQTSIENEDVSDVTLTNEEFSFFLHKKATDDKRDINEQINYIKNSHFRNIANYPKPKPLPRKHLPSISAQVKKSTEPVKINPSRSLINRSDKYFRARNMKSSHSFTVKHSKELQEELQLNFKNSDSSDESEIVQTGNSTERIGDEELFVDPNKLQHNSTYYENGDDDDDDDDEESIDIPLTDRYSPEKFRKIQGIDELSLCSTEIEDVNCEFDMKLNDSIQDYSNDDISSIGERSINYSVEMKNIMGMEENHIHSETSSPAPIIQTIHIPNRTIKPLPPIRQLKKTQSTSYDLSLKNSISSTSSTDDSETKYYGGTIDRIKSTLEKDEELRKCFQVLDRKPEISTSQNMNNLPRTVKESSFNDFERKFGLESEIESSTHSFMNKLYSMVNSADEITDQVQDLNDLTIDIQSDDDDDDDYKKSKNHRSFVKSPEDNVSYVRSCSSFDEYSHCSSIFGEDSDSPISIDERRLPDIDDLLSVRSDKVEEKKLVQKTEKLSNLKSGRINRCRELLTYCNDQLDDLKSKVDETKNLVNSPNKSTCSITSSNDYRNVPKNKKFNEILCLLEDHLENIPEEKEKKPPIIIKLPSPYSKILPIVPIRRKFKFPKIVSIVNLPNDILWKVFKYLPLRQHAQLLLIPKFNYLINRKLPWQRIRFVSHNNVNDACLRLIGKRQPNNLSLVCCSGNSITRERLNDMLKSISENLNDFQLEGCLHYPLNANTIVRQLTGYLPSNLTKLNCSLSSLSSDVLNNFIKLSNCKLTELRLDGCNEIGDSSFQLICEEYFDSLNSLSISGCFKISRECIMKSVSSLWKLSFLDISCLKRIDDNVISIISKNMTQLQYFNVNRSPCLQNSFLNLLTYGCTQIVAIEIAYCSAITDAFLRNLSIIDLPNLRNLNLCGCALSNDAFEQFFQSGFLLQLLDISSTKIKFSGILQLCKFSSSLETLKMNNIHLTAPNFAIVLQLFTEFTKLKELQTFGNVYEKNAVIAGLFECFERNGIVVNKIRNKYERKTEIF
ncbi:hypothetical protein SNEBB_006338 [Seison nebaliae]|nr:hypothetical protein SNEBB_006338 [Seison nebaliae]